MGRIHLRTLADVAHHGRNVRITCAGCGHWRVSDGRQLHWLFLRNGYPLAMSRLHEHLRCSSCGEKRVGVQATGEPTRVRPPPRPRLRVIDGGDV